MKIAFSIVITTALLFACGTGKDKKSNSSTVETSAENNETVNEIRIEETVVEPVVITRPDYNPSATILTDIVHTKLEVNFIWEKSQMNGMATLTCSPYFYPTDSLILDAKSMEIFSVMLNDKPLTFKYNDQKFLRIKLDRTYTRDEQYTVMIKYKAKPEEKEEGGSSAITSDKGLYFINPTGEDPNKMPQIWTQGETEASSVWFPTVDRPNQKTTQEIFITVEDKYKTLSNGKLISSKKNKDGTRTDYWKQDLPHVPYLFMMAVGEFKVVEDFYTRPDGTKMPVHYYVEPEWEEHAQAIFGETPEMIGFFSNLLGVEYPWDKYHQVVVRDYVSGAMENTGAVIFGDFVYKTKRELIDGNDHSIIAHELFHHWFGDLVTCESWANLPLNESFANYSQYLWDEHYYGRDEADYNAEKEAEGYYQSAAQMGHHDMIWYDYPEKEAMFDGHSYNKGGRILHMLRYYLGDDAFFTSLKNYLKIHQYKPVEIHDLRIAFEDVSGEDLNWFFNQWFFASYHPELEVTQDLSIPDQVTLTIKQVQDLEKAPLYKLPMKIAVFENGKKTSHNVVVDKNINTFTFRYKGKLDNVIVDEDRVMLGSINHEKPREWYIHQYYNAPLYKDREQAVVYGSRDRSEEGKQLILDALNDDFWYIRQLAISNLKKIKRDKEAEVFTALENIVKTDSSSTVRAAALKFLSSEYFEGDYASSTRRLLQHAIEKDSSYFVISRGLGGLLNGDESDKEKAITMAEKMENENSSALRSQIIHIYKTASLANKLDYMAETILAGKVSGYDAIGAMGSFTGLLKEQDVPTKEKYLGTYEKLSETGGIYIQAVLPMNVMMLKRDTEEQISDLNAELIKLEKAGDEEKAAQKRLEIKNTNAFLDKVNALMLKVNG
ncbi:MAG: M1 family metallopeptidase [Brumimicrobium sp.]|nr:M1 family metallopeptidase [Brumimicrobium sp.]